MRNPGQMIFAIILILLGIILMLGNLLDVNVWKLVWPAGIILFGLWLLLRPRFSSSETSTQVLLGDYRRRGEWQVSEQDIFLGIGDAVLDMSDAEIPLGETRIRVWGFVADVKLTVPRDVGVAVSSNAFFTEVKGLGKKREVFLSALNLASDNYQQAARQIRLEASYFVADIKVRQI